MLGKYVNEYLKELRTKIFSNEFLKNSVLKILQMTNRYTFQINVTPGIEDDVELLKNEQLVFEEDGQTYVVGLLYQVVDTYEPQITQTPVSVQEPINPLDMEDVEKFLYSQLISAYKKFKETQIKTDNMLDELYSSETNIPESPEEDVGE